MSSSHLDTGCLMVAFASLRRLSLPVVAILAISACRTPPPATTPVPAAPPAVVPAVSVREDSVRRPAVVFADGWRFAKNEPATFAEHGMVSSNAPLASSAGADIMKMGGNAVDAAVATGFALAVVWPEAGNIGGGGYMVIQMADGRREVVDYREVAPLAGSRDMYLKPDGTTDGSIIGWRSSGVPGAVAGLVAAQAKYGKLTRAQVMAPAIRMARDGFLVDSGLFTSVTRSRALIARFAGKEVFLPRDSVLAIGSTFRQPALARTLDAIARDGADVYYRGWIADSIAAEEKRGGGIITKADLAKYTARWREPLVWTYRDYTLVGMPPSSSGGVTMAETMNILEHEAHMPSFGSVAYLHLLGSAYQRAFIDRNSKLADPDFYPVPTAQLASKTYARGLFNAIDRTHATPTPAVTQQMVEGLHTTHYSVVDGDGSAVATTTTLNNSWGSGVYLASVGFMMNDQMDDFAVQPGKPNMFGLVQGEANKIEPGKRMLSAMSPTVVLDAQGRVQMVAGAAGGPRIISATSQVILNVIEFGMPLADAMRAPRMHNQALPDELRLETNGYPATTIDSLRAMGHSVAFLGGIANVNAIRRVPGGWHGVSEPRAFGAAIGY
ncbi:MAG: gamma-glutamyltransferase [Gemmatimonadaceae bacterium]|nr:gamma-glutamyltransferase [Gemmatimonadaceae bacterium]